MRSLNAIANAELAYVSMTGRYATLEELDSQGLIDSALGSGVKSGYRFTIELTDHNDVLTNVQRPGFEAVGVPVEYRSSGMRSFYTDETIVIRGADNHGGSSGKHDDPLQTVPSRRQVSFTPPENY
ncbi:MAG TPA: hypothetical protein VLB87_04190 [Pyrinomonadaceae bacterium]|nr:hypothetical protein [Pyrinomonadaceae bacterium]